MSSRTVVALSQALCAALGLSSQALSWFAVASVAVASLAGAGCARCGEEPPAALAPSDPGPAPPVAPGLSPSEAATAAEVARLMGELKQRPQCNRVMGCPPAVGLAQHAEAAVPALVEAVRTSDKRAGFWLLKSIDLLGQLGDASVLPTLHPLLADTRWEVRAQAALAVARIGSPDSAPVLLRVLELLDADPNTSARDPTRRAGVLYALSALGVDVGGRRARTLLAEALPRSREALGKLNPGYYAFLADLVREARLIEAAPLVRLAAIHKDRFVRLAGLAALGALGDDEGVPYAVTRLDDELPSVRRASLAALRRITGLTDLTTPEDWKAWCAHRDCLAPLRAEPGPAEGGDDGRAGGGGGAEPQQP